MARMLVLGVGNSLLTDDGAGVHAAVLLNEHVGHPPDLTILDAGTLGFSLLSALGDADALIAFDAARTGGEPGDISIHEGVDFDRFVRRAGRSVHEVGLADLLDMARLSGHLPERRVLIGIEPQRVDWGLVPTPQVAAALPQCVAVALDLIEHWRSDTKELTAVTVEETHAH
ncbi:MAG TPA: HyaD/HybD family hydrogenase maturation endopeptidase [Steroidobacteraceae bacterium]|nr:HyaD/HybD family hydrogenase maturation endopeptidase [Steroidobacteraceae bacterium]